MIELLDHCSRNTLMFSAQLTDLRDRFQYKYFYKYFQINGVLSENGQKL